MIKVFETRDYKQFKRLAGNRTVNEVHLSRLRRSMQKNCYPTIIYVNEKKEVLDGQHRLTVLEELNKPVLYAVLEGATHETVHTLNTNGLKWSLQDYAESYAELGEPNYIRFIEFQKENPKLKPNVVFYILSGKHKDTRSLDNFRTGKFEPISEFEIMDILYKLSAFKESKNYEYQSFIFGVIRLFKHPDYNHERMVSKLEKGMELLDKYRNPSMSTVLQLLTEIYNANLRREERIYFYE